MGTPEFAVPTLQALHGAGHETVAVYTQPDRPKGRGQALAASPVKQAALALGLTVLQPEKIRDAYFELAAAGAEAMVVVGYGQIIPQRIIDLPRHGIINVHASLLPKYRGAAPIQWAMANGERVTGVTTMQIDAGLDTGDILLMDETEIGVDETAVELGIRLSRQGALLAVRTLAEIGAIRPRSQDHAEATIARILEKPDGVIDWSLSAVAIHNRVRGFQPWPGGVARFRDQPLTLHRTRLAESGTSEATGALSVTNKRLYVACGQRTAIEILELQPAGKKRISASDFVNGARLQVGERLA